MMNTFPLPTIMLADAQRNALSARIAAETYPLNGPFAPYIARTGAAVSAVLEDGQRRMLADLPHLGALVIDNVPVDANVLSGPIDPEAPIRAKPTGISEAVLTGFVAQCGVPYAIVQEGRSLVSNVAAKLGRTKTLTGLGAVQLNPHIENAFGRTFRQDRSPAGLALIGVCREPGGSPATYVADGRIALDMLSEEDRAILFEERFWIRRPERWRRTDMPTERRTAVVVPGPGDRIALIIATYGDMIRADDDRAAVALQAFIRALQTVAVGVVIDPGRLILIDNRCMLHGRCGYAATFTRDGAPYRWLQRLFWTDALDQFGGWQAGDHLIDTLREP
ncbi:TauD/TfdA family dioxygenase [Tistrella sp.]|nr:TauD/TfdA family dioxygenase [Tistrella sp.]